MEQIRFSPIFVFKRSFFLESFVLYELLVALNAIRQTTKEL